MTEIIFLLTGVAFFSLIYIYVGYPVLMAVMAKLAPAKPVRKCDITPSVSLLISCYNEEKVIREKLENAIRLDYPSALLDIVVISDGSTDGTDDIVREYADRGVCLLRQEGRLGKTSGLNMAVDASQSEIIVFSDANALYKRDAIKRLVENFHDDTVGYVVGEAQYVDRNASAASKTENTYWNYEITLKKLESRVHSIVGGDGAIYAIRRSLYEPLEPADINDFVNPLQIIAKGYRGVYEPAAICKENTAGDFEKEFRRKSRIVNRSFSGLLRVSTVLNPFKCGIYSIQIVSHKVLRWFAGIFIGLFFIGSFILALNGMIFFQAIALIEVFLMECAYVGYLLRKRKTLSVFYFLYYFAGVNLAALHGVYLSLKGNVQVAWEPHRSMSGEKQEPSRAPLFVHLSAAMLVLCTLVIVQELFEIHLHMWKIGFGASISSIVYSFCGYPLLLAIFCRLAPHPVQKKEIIPTVTMLVCAYNEAEVIEQKIQNSLELDYPPEKLQIIIASDGSSDRTVEIAKQFNDPRLIIKDYPTRIGKIGAINCTMPECSGDLVLFSDANTILERESVRMLVRNFADKRVGGASGDVILSNELTPFSTGEVLYYRYERFIQQKESCVESIIGADGGMYAIRRSSFIEPKADTIIDDFVISMNVALQGYRVVYEPEARGHEINRMSSREEFSRKARVVAGAIQALKSGQGIPTTSQKRLWWSYVSHKVLRWMTPALIIVFVATTWRLALEPQKSGFMVLAILQLGFIIMALAGGLMKQRIGHPLLIVPFYFCLEHAAALYGIYKGLFDKQTVKWETFRKQRLPDETSFRRN